MKLSLGLPSATYPKASRTYHALPRLSRWSRNINLLPFCVMVISLTLRIA